MITTVLCRYGVLLMLGMLLPPQAATAQTTLFDVPGPGGSTLFHLNDDASLVSFGTFGQGTIPVQGPGVRLMWHPAKGAFRAGGIDDRQWNDTNVGDYSVAMGWNAEASGDYATAIGRNTVASGSTSTAMGNGTTASGPASTAMGLVSTASGSTSIATGSFTTASGILTTTMGLRTTAQAYLSLVLGRNNTITGNTDLWVPSDPILVVGNGTDTNPSNALTLLKNGNLTIAGTLTENSDQRLKEGIIPLTEVLNDLARLQPIRYRFRAGTNRPEGEHIGLIAQEVEAVFPELVGQDADGYLSVSYTHLTAVLVQALNEQQAEIKALRKDNTTLHKRLSRLEAALLHLQARPASNDR